MFLCFLNLFNIKYFFTLHFILLESYFILLDLLIKEKFDPENNGH
jgi:hypothetical protein